MLRKCSFAVNLLVFFIATFSMADDEAITFKATSLGGGLHVIQGEGGFTGGNILLSVGEDGVVIIDGSMPPFLEKLQATVKSVADAPIDFLINTHIHQDHTGNNVALHALGAHIVGHKNLRERLRMTDVEGDKGKHPISPKALPVITLEHELTFHLNGDEARIIHLPSAHTDGDLIVHFPKANVIHTGDILFSGLYPYIDLDNGGSVKGYIEAQKTIYAMANKDTILVPGHGPVATIKEMKNSIKMLEEAYKTVQQWKGKGKSEDEVVAANPLKKFDKEWSWGFVNTEKMTRTLYQ